MAGAFAGHASRVDPLLSAPVPFTLFTHTLKYAIKERIPYLNLSRAAGAELSQPGPAPLHLVCPGAAHPRGGKKVRLSKLPAGMAVRLSLLHQSDILDRCGHHHLRPAPLPGRCRADAAVVRLSCPLLRAAFRPHTICRGKNLTISAAAAAHFLGGAGISPLISFQRVSLGKPRLFPVPAAAAYAVGGY
ncbi:MAG: hypothetical protein BWY71_01959 [Planctomycetes bacterium ADurb.Bin412]|nr:MAG: hypothetical protein BWY71_01959 [Planctomycetes bacterium ADurb.Bin412]